MKIFKNLFVLLYFLQIVSSSSESLQASDTNQGIMLFAGTLASVVAANQILKFKNELEKDNPFGNQDKVHRYLENKLSELQASKDINTPLVARLILSSKGYTPAYKEYDTYIQAAHELAQLDKEQMNMKHLEAAIHGKYGKKTHAVMNEQERRATAIHELGHALAIIHKLRNAKILYLVEIEARAQKDDIESGGQNIAIPIKPTVHLPEKEWINQIIVSLSGGIAVQVVRDDGTSIKSLQAMLSDPVCSVDVKIAYKYAEKIAMQNMLRQYYTRFIPLYNEVKEGFDMFTPEEKVKIKEDAHQIIASCYDEAYDFVVQHKAEIKLAIDMLLKSGNLFGDDLYKLWKVPKPEYDFE